MNDITGRQAQPDMDDVPVIPRWVNEWGWITLAIPAVIYCVIAVAAGHAYGADAGWGLFLAAVLGAVSLLGADYARRLRSARVRREQARYEQLEIDKITVAGWRGFEDYCGNLLRARGYEHVVRVADTKNRKQVDFTAIAPDRTPVAVECKYRSKDKLGPELVDRIAGALTRDPYKWHKGILMTSADATDGAKAAAEGAGIELVDLPLLRQWISEARTGLGHSLDQRRAHPAMKALVGVACVLVVLPVVMAFTLPSSAQPKATTKAPQATAPAPSGPSVVMREFYQAISQHNWHRVWRLGGKNLGHGPYASFSGMVAGYRETERDTLRALAVSGDTATGWFLAYQTTGVQAYSFRYIVRGGTITGGYQVPVARR
jgi:hypothetical protein